MEPQNKLTQKLKIPLSTFHVPHSYLLKKGTPPSENPHQHHPSIIIDNPKNKSMEFAATVVTRQIHLDGLPGLFFTFLTSQTTLSSSLPHLKIFDDRDQPRTVHT